MHELIATLIAVARRLSDICRATLGIDAAGGDLAAEFVRVTGQTGGPKA